MLIVAQRLRHHSSGWYHTTAHSTVRQIAWRHWCVSGISTNTEMNGSSRCHIGVLSHSFPLPREYSNNIGPRHRPTSIRLQIGLGIIRVWRGLNPSRLTPCHAGISFSVIHWHLRLSANFIQDYTQAVQRIEYYWCELQQCKFRYYLTLFKSNHFTQWKFHTNALTCWTIYIKIYSLKCAQFSRGCIQYSFYVHEYYRNLVCLFNFSFMYIVS